ncbi:unnamed protein product [Ixodes persulcatus]
MVTNNAWIWASWFDMGISNLLVFYIKLMPISYAIQLHINIFREQKSIRITNQTPAYIAIFYGRRMGDPCLAHFSVITHPIYIMVNSHIYHIFLYAKHKHKLIGFLSIVDFKISTLSQMFLLNCFTHPAKTGIKYVYMSYKE